MSAYLVLQLPRDVKETTFGNVLLDLVNIPCRRVLVKTWKECKIGQSCRLAWHFGVHWKRFRLQAHNSTTPLHKCSLQYSTLSPRLSYNLLLPVIGSYTQILPPSRSHLLDNKGIMPLLVVLPAKVLQISNAAATLPHNYTISDSFLTPLTQFINLCHQWAAGKLRSDGCPTG